MFLKIQNAFEGDPETRDSFLVFREPQQPSSAAAGARRALLLVSTHGSTGPAPDMPAELRKHIFMGAVRCRKYKTLQAHAVIEST